MNMMIKIKELDMRLESIIHSVKVVGESYQNNIVQVDVLNDKIQHLEDEIEKLRKENEKLKKIKKLKI